jgi:hypothetical protein
LAIAVLMPAGAGLAGAFARTPARRPAAGHQLAPPRFGHTLDIGLISGTVIVTPPNQASFSLGTQDRTIPIGSLIDTTRGRVDMRAARPPGFVSVQSRTIDDVELYDGAFRVSQAKGAVDTGVRLSGGGFSRCTGRAAAATAATGTARADSVVPHRAIRLLWARGTGTFRTVGRYAAATVRGTYWMTADYCDGTLVRVRRGVVSVTDLVNRRTATITAGESYFVPRPVGP